MRVVELLAAAVLLGTTAMAQEEEFCLECHGSVGDLQGFVDDLRDSLVVDGPLFEQSVHSGFACGDCHFGFDELPHEEGAESANCGFCHDDYAEELVGSVHGPREGIEAVDCSACHGVHDVLRADQRESRLHPLNVFRTCGQCHLEEFNLARATIHDLLRLPMANYAHARGILRAGLVHSATCVSCHGAHGIKAEGDPTSRVSRANVVETCGACHLGVSERHSTGVHGHRTDASAEGQAGPTVAVCTDCHLPHAIDRVDADSFRLGIVDECAACHAFESETYRETFHGKASTLGGDRPAKCHDCHGAHGILPISDAESTLSPFNIVETCAQCHEGAHPRFTEYLPHATHGDPERWPWLYYAFWSMTLLLTSTMAVAFAHTLLFLIRLLLDRKEWRAHQAAIRAGKGDLRLYRRFNRVQRTLHVFMIMSFMSLALTGMMQKFSWTPWAVWLSDKMGGIEQANGLHRLSAMWLIAVFIAHVYYALRIKRVKKRSWLQVISASDSILFNVNDLTEIRQTMKWFFGFGPRPKYGRFTYWEKFDYFAVFWGIFIIGSTGFALWFPVQATYIFPGWMLNVFTIVHSDEALLASAFIFTIHFFNANFRPDKFPMDMTMFTGRITLEELKYERPREYEDMLRSGELERNLVEPLPEAAVNAMRVFASLALLTGVGLVVLIAYSLSQYLFD